MSEEQPPTETSDDKRLYVQNSEGWQAHVKSNWEKEYCFAHAPGEDHFHLLLCGEVYLQHGDEKYCLNCAMRRGILTHDRLNWQRGGTEA